MTAALGRSAMRTPGLNRALLGAALGALVGAGGLFAARIIGLKAEPGQLLLLGEILESQRDVVGDCHHWNERELLMHHSNPGSDCIRWRSKSSAIAIHLHPA